MALRIALVAALLFACSEKVPGRKLASGIGQGLVAHEGAVAFLLNAGHPDDRGVPEDLLAGDLWLAPAGGAAKKVASGVSSQGGMYAFSRSGDRFALLGSWRFREGEGELFVAAPGSEPVQLAKSVREFSWAPRETALAFVDRDELGIWTPSSSRRVPVEGLRNVAWSPDGKRIAARAGAAAGGRLVVVNAATGAAKEVAPDTSDFAFAPDGALAALGPPPAKGGDRPLLLDGKEIARATSFAFSPDGKDVALLVTGKQPGEATGDLYRLPRAGGPAKLLGEKVSDWRWDDDGDLLFLARYDLRARAGVLTASVAGAPPRPIAPKVQSFVAQGRRVLYLAQAPKKGDFRIELWGIDLASAKEPHKIDEGVYGWELAGDTLFYKARCAGGPRSCALLRAPFAGGAAPELLALDVAGFDLSQDRSRILVQRPHRGAPRAVDLAVLGAKAPAQGEAKPFVEEADPASCFADAAGKRVVYALTRAEKRGVYLADVP